MYNTENHFYCQKCLNCPDRNKPVSTPLSQVSRETGVPLLAIQDLQQNDVVKNPLTCQCLAALRWHGNFLGAFGDDYKPGSQRKSKLEHWSLRKDYQKCIYENYMLHQSEEKIYVRVVAAEAAVKFNLHNSKALHDEIRDIRITVYNDRRRARESGRSVEEIIEERFAQQEMDFDDDDQ